jgi:hypothetical protein
MTELEKDIETALNANVDLSEEEYRAVCEKADGCTKAHGVKGRAALSEGRRHKRVQMNFYATALNILINIYQLTAEIAESLKELNDGRSGKNK